MRPLEERAYTGWVTAPVYHVHSIGEDQTEKYVTTDTLAKVSMMVHVFMENGWFDVSADVTCSLGVSSSNINENTVLGCCLVLDATAGTH